MTGQDLIAMTPAMILAVGVLFSLLAERCLRLGALRHNIKTQRWGLVWAGLAAVLIAVPAYFTPLA